MLKEGLNRDLKLIPMSRDFSFIWQIHGGFQTSPERNRKIPKPIFKTAIESITLETMAEAEEPLMRHDDEEEALDVDLSDVSLLLEKNLRHPGIFVWLLTFSAGISGLLFGCM